MWFHTISVKGGNDKGAEIKKKTKKQKQQHWHINQAIKDC